MLHDSFAKINLNPNLSFCRFSFHQTAGVADVRGQNRLFTSNGFPSPKRAGPLYSKVSRQFQSTKFHLSGAILLHGLRPIDRTRQPSRYRIVSSGNERSRIPYGHKKQGFQKYHSRCKRKPRLAYLFRIRTDTYSRSSKALCKGAFWSRSGRNRIRSGFNYDRPLPFNVSMGAISQHEECRQDAYPLGPSRPDSCIYKHYGRQDPRCQHSRPDPTGTRFVLCDGSRLSGFRTVVQDTRQFSLFHCTAKKKHTNPKTVFPLRGQVHRTKVRPDCSVVQLLPSKRLSRKTTTNPEHRRRNRNGPFAVDQQLHITRAHYSQTLQGTMERGVVLQMDQTASSNQGIFRYLRKRSQNANLDFDIHICSHRHNQEEIEDGAASLHNPTDSEPYPIRKKTPILKLFSDDQIQTKETPTSIQLDLFDL